MKRNSNFELLLLILNLIKNKLMLVDIEKKIRQIRELKGFSQEFIANSLNISIRAYSKIETGETQLTINRLNEISSILEITPQEILGFDSSLIFNNNSTNQQGGEFVAYNNTEIEYVKHLYEKLLEEKDKMIAVLQKQLFEK